MGAGRQRGPGGLVAGALVVLSLVGLGCVPRSAGVANIAIQTAEKVALLALSEAVIPYRIQGTNYTANPNWWTVVGWVNATRPCNFLKPWRFVQCTADQRVSVIDFGVLPPAVKLAGKIPWANMTALEHLTVFKLSNQSISGTAFPDDMPSLPSLRNLTLNGNNLSALTSQVSQLANLIHLDLSRNPMINSSIPKEISNMTSLQTLILAGCYLSGGLPDFAPSNNLSLVALHYNFLTGGIPQSWSQLKVPMDMDPFAPVALVLEHNQLSGELPPWISTLGFHGLILGNNLFYGPLPSTLWSAAYPVGTLLLLGLEDNYFNGTIPSSVSPGNGTIWGGLTVSGNCLTNTEFGVQRPAANCTAFYGNHSQSPVSPTGSPSPPSNNGTIGYPPPPPSSSSTNLGLIIGLSVAGGVLILVLIGLLVYLLLNKRRDDEEYDDEVDEDDDKDKEDEDDDDDHHDRDDDDDDHDDDRKR